MGLTNYILTCEKDNEKLRYDLSYYKSYSKRLKEKNAKYKEAVNKIKKICESTPPDWSICGIEVVSRIENILKEVE